MRNTADTLAIRGNAATISSACEVHSLELQGEQRRATLLLLNPNWSLVSNVIGLLDGGQDIQLFPCTSQTAPAR